jgi:hypothetical protein
MMPVRDGLITSVFVLTAASVGGQPSPVLTWSGSMHSNGAAPVHLRYRIPTTPSSLDGFVILVSDGTTPHDVSATDVQFSGISVLFRATFASNARCKLDAVPARGYAGSCVLESGDTATLTLVPPVPGMLLPDHEVALARDAAPPHLAQDASVFVLGASGYYEAARGTNGFTCFIQRPTPNDLWPICHAREASRTILPVEQFRAGLRISGLDERRISDSVATAYHRGRFRPPPGGAIGYMLSTRAWTVDTATGSREFIAPHLHFYAPYATNARAGIDSTGNGVLPMRLEHEGKPDASVIVGVRLRKPT